MSKERARRRSARQELEAAQRAREARTLARRLRRQAILRRVRSLGRGSLTPGAQGGAGAQKLRAPSTALGRHRARQNGTLLVVLFAAHLVLWIYQSSWWVRGSAAVLTLLAWPLLVVVLYDRRNSR